MSLEVTSVILFVGCTKLPNQILIRVFSSIKQAHGGSVVPMDNKLVHLNSCSYSGEIVKLQFPLDDDSNNFFQEKSHRYCTRTHNLMYHI